MMFNVIGDIEIAEELDNGDDLEIRFNDDFDSHVQYLTKSEAEDLADHIYKVLRESKP